MRGMNITILADKFQAMKNAKALKDQLSSQTPLHVVVNRGNLNGMTLAHRMKDKKNSIASKKEDQLPPVVEFDFQQPAEE